MGMDIAVGRMLKFNPSVLYWLYIYRTPPGILVFFFLGEVLDRSSPWVVASLGGSQGPCQIGDWGTCHGKPGVPFPTLYPGIGPAAQQA